MSAQLIRADGLDWPIERYLDSFGYIRTERERPAFLRVGIEFRADVVTAGGQVLRERYTAEIPWWEVIAFRPLDASIDLAVCDECGEPYVGGECEGCDGGFWSGF